MLAVKPGVYRRWDWTATGRQTKRCILSNFKKPMTREYDLIYRSFFGNLFTTLLRGRQVRKKQNASRYLADSSRTLRPLILYLSVRGSQRKQHCSHHQQGERKSTSTLLRNPKSEADSRRAHHVYCKTQSPNFLRRPNSEARL